VICRNIQKAESSSEEEQEKLNKTHCFGRHMISVMLLRDCDKKSTAAPSIDTAEVELRK